MKAAYVSWGIHTKRPGKVEQAISPKIRWAKQIRPEPDESKRRIKPKTKPE